MVRAAATRTVDTSPLAAPTGEDPPKNHEALMKRYSQARRQPSIHIISTPFTGYSIQDMERMEATTLKNALDIIEMHNTGTLPPELGTETPPRTPTPSMTDLRLAALGPRNAGYASLKQVLTTAARRR